MPKHPYHELFKGDLVDDDGNLGPIGEELADALPSLGESSGLTPVDLAFTFATAGIAEIAPNPQDGGVVLYDPNPGDLLLIDSYISVTTAFDAPANGDGTPALAVVAQGASRSADRLILVSDATVVDTTPRVGMRLPAGLLAGTFATGGVILDGTPLVLVLFDSAYDGDPGSTVGVGSVRLLIVPAPA